MPRYIVQKAKDLLPDQEIAASTPGVRQQFPLTRSTIITDIIDADEMCIDDITDCPHVLSVMPDEPITIPEPVASTAVSPPPFNQGIAMHGADAVWAEGFRGKGIRVAVLDTGIDAKHMKATFGGRIKAKRNFTRDQNAYDGNGHGTHVAGIVGGPHDYGIAPDCEILVGKVLANSGTGYTSWILAGIEWAFNAQVDIINLSLGGSACHTNDPLVALIEHIRHRGVIPVVAAGNNGCITRTEADTSSPACSSDAITVAALDEDYRPAHFSSCGEAVDIAAFGQDVMSLWTNGSVRAISGTSMACPQVAGGLALMLSAWKRPNDVRRAMYRGVEPLSVSPTKVGIGSLDITHSVDLLRTARRDGY